MRNLFSKQYKCVTNHLHLYVTNYYIFVFTVTPYCLLCALVLSMQIHPQIQHLQLLSYVTKLAHVQSTFFIFFKAL